MIRQRLRAAVCATFLLVTMAGCGVGTGNDPGVRLIVSSTPATESSQPLPLPTRPPERPVPQKQTNDPTVMYSTSFDDDASQLFFVGETDFGALASIVDGAYRIEVANGEWQTIAPGPMPHPQNGVIEADVTLTGSGYGGLVARSSIDDAGDYWMYVCLIDESGWAGCVASLGDTYQDLFWAEIDGYAPGIAQRMRIAVVDDRIELTVNDGVIGSAQDATVQFGSWGVFAESQPDMPATVTFDNLTISVVPPGFDPFGSPGEDAGRAAHLARQSMS